MKKIPNKFNLSAIYEDANPIHSISSETARNILRGLINTDSNYIKAIEKIEKSVNLNTAKKTLNVIRNNNFFEKNKISRDYPDYFRFGYPLRYEFSENEIINKINENQLKLLNALSIIEELYTLLISYRYDEIITKCNDIYRKVGVSIFLLRFLLIIKGLAENSPEKSFKDIITKVNIQLNLYKVKNIKSIEIALKELSIPRTDYLAVTTKIKSIVPENWKEFVIKSFVETSPTNTSNYLKTLNGYYSISLLDSLLYILYVSNFSSNNKKLNEEFIFKYHKIQHIQIDINLLDFSKENFFRSSFMLRENLNIAKYHSIHCCLQSKNENKFFEIKEIERNWIAKYFESVSDLKSLNCQNIVTLQINLTNFNPNTCSVLENSSALVYIINQNKKVSDYDNFIKLMSYTSNIGEILPNYLLGQILSSSSNADLNFQLVLACLQTIKSRDDQLDAKLRRIVQRLIDNNYQGDLIQFLKALYKKSPSVTEHLVHICDEKFLSLFFYKKSSTPIDAIKNRADILEWYGNEINDSIYVEKAKNLRIDIEIIKEKGVIDDARIYVDPFRFNQWINDNTINQIALSLDSIIEDEKNINLYDINWAKVKTGLSPLDNLASDILLCYEAFCTNNIFGIASYLGRRIRHGTLKGTATKDLIELSKQHRFSSLFENVGFKNAFSTWLNLYNSNIDKIHNSVHIFDEKNSIGLIRITIDDSPLKRKHVAILLNEIINSYEKQKNITEIPFLINEICWRIIEIELKKVREYISHQKKIFDISPSFEFNSDVMHLFHSFKSEVNSIINDKFRIIISWFNKPSIASPETDIVLLFNAVVSGIKDSVSGFQPKINIETKGYRISGGMYFIIYDALYIIIDNAAKHGNPKGNIYFNIESIDKVIRVIVKSECSLNDSLSSVKSKINSCLKEVREDAYLIEGNSGIKKLKKLETDKYIENVIYSYDDSSSTIITSFDFVLGYQL